MAQDRPHDGRGNWLDTEGDGTDESVRLLRSIASNIATIKSILIAWSVLFLFGAGVTIVLVIAAASEANS